ncbi:restriction endonuclease subunit S [Specibacter sp. NPDC078692]|uniref:restriction endonuclease subunit S n=1 Tax=Specibacter sp. NPDC078692 TaxID=3155818 RepID=UPI0034130864
MSRKTMKIQDIAAPSARSIAIGPFGSNLKAELYTPSGVPVVRGQNIKASPYLDEEDLVFVSPETAEKLSSSMLNEGDLVFPHRGAIGRVGLVGKKRMLLSSSMMKLTVDPAKADPKYVLYYFRGPGERELLMRASTVGTPGIGQPLTSLRGISIELPELEQQQAIAEVLGALDDKIAANTKLAATFESLGTAKLQALGINAEPEAGFVTLDTLFDFNPRRTPASDTVTLIDMQALPTSEPLVGTWSEGPKKGGTRFMNGDTLLARITPCLENRKTGFVDFLDDGQVGIGSTEFIVMRSREGLPLGLSYFVATSSRFRDFAIQNMVGTSGRQRVAAADIARFEFNPIESTDLVEFGSWADTNLRLLGSLRTENKTLAATRDALLPQLMSGKLRVKEAEALVSAAV